LAGKKSLRPRLEQAYGTEAPESAAGPFTVKAMAKRVFKIRTPSHSQKQSVRNGLHGLAQASPARYGFAQNTQGEWVTVRYALPQKMPRIMFVNPMAKTLMDAIATSSFSSDLASLVELRDFFIRAVIQAKAATEQAQVQRDKQYLLKGY
jgi:hypothetical protein